MESRKHLHSCLKPLPPFIDPTGEVSEYIAEYLTFGARQPQQDVHGPITHQRRAFRTKLLLITIKLWALHVFFFTLFAAARNAHCIVGLYKCLLKNWTDESISEPYCAYMENGKTVFIGWLKWLKFVTCLLHHLAHSNCSMNGCVVTNIPGPCRGWRRNWLILQRGGGGSYEKGIIHSTMLPSPGFWVTSPHVRGASPWDILRNIGG